jgi:serine/threonine-protein kinase
MATGEHPFQSETQARLIGSIMESDPPPPSKQRPHIPERIDWVVERCLEKDPERRWQSARDLTLELGSLDVAEAAVTEASGPVPPAASRRPRKRQLLAVALAVLAIAAGVAWLTMWREPRVAAPVVVSRLAINPSPGESWVISTHDPDVAISPDGERIGYIGRRGGENHLVVRRLDEFEGSSLGSFGGAVRSPFFSPDGEWVGFVDGNTLKRVAVDGSATVTICVLPGFLSGATWGSDNTLVLGTLIHGLFRVPASGGEPAPLETAAFQEGGIARWPHLLPDGRAVLFASGQGVAQSEIRVRSLVSDDEKVIVQGATFPRYAGTGHLLYVADSVLWAVAFDTEQLEVVGDAIPIVDGVMIKGPRQTGLGAANVGISGNGTLVYRPAGAAGSASTLVWVDREGREEQLDLGAQAYGRMQLSPDGSRIAIEITDANLTNTDIWVGDVQGPSLSQLTFDPAVDGYPVWAPDGRRVLFRSQRGGGSLLSRSAGGTGPVEQLPTSSAGQLCCVTPDGSDLVHVNQTGYWGVSLDSAGGEHRLDLEAGWVPALSPDGRYLANISDVTGDFEVYVQPYPNPDGVKWRITSGGGRDPAWSRDGRELFYQKDNTMFATAITTEPTFSARPAVALFDGPYIDSMGRWYDVAPDGRFLMLKPGWLSEGRETPVMHIVLNWFEELKRLVPTQ